MAKNQLYARQQPSGQIGADFQFKVWVQASESIRERVESGQRIGWALLFALVALLFAEHILANVTSRN